MTFTNILNKFPKSLKFTKKENVINLIIRGQGVFIFENQDPAKNCSFKILNNDETFGLKIEFTSTSVLVNDISTQDTFIDTDNNQGLSNKNGAYYWFSLDAQNQKLYAGIGEARTDTIIYAYQFEQTNENKLFLESLVTIITSKSSSINPLKLLRDPVTNDTPLLVKNTDELSMDDCSLFLSLGRSSFLSHRVLFNISCDCFIGNSTFDLSKTILATLYLDGFLEYKCFCKSPKSATR